MKYAFTSVASTRYSLPISSRYGASPETSVLDVLIHADAEPTSAQHNARHLNARPENNDQNMRRSARYASNDDDPTMTVSLTTVGVEWRPISPFSRSSCLSLPMTTPTFRSTTPL